MECIFLGSHSDHRLVSPLLKSNNDVFIGNNGIREEKKWLLDLFVICLCSGGGCGGCASGIASEHKQIAVGPINCQANRWHASTHSHWYSALVWWRFFLLFFLSVQSPSLAHFFLISFSVSIVPKPLLHIARVLSHFNAFIFNVIVSKQCALAIVQRVCDHRKCTFK